MRKKYLVKPVLVSLIAVGIYLVLSLGFGLFNRAKFFSSDIFTTIRYHLKPVPESAKEIVILSIDNTAYDWFGKKWPWDREVFAELVYRLSSLQPKVIGLNLAFMGASKNKAVDDLLAHSFTAAGNVITASYFDNKGGYHAPYDILATSCKGFGFTNKPADKDMAIRRAKIFTKTVHDIILDYSFELKAACLYKDTSYESKIQGIPVNKNGTMILNYLAKLNDFTLIPVLDILQNKVPQEALKDKILLLGMTGEAFRDIQRTPFGPMPGAVIIANNILMFLEDSYIKKIPIWVDSILLVLIAFFYAILFYKSSSKDGIIYLLTSVFAFVLISIVLVLFNIQWEFFSIPFVMLVVYAVTNSYKNIGLFIEDTLIKRSLIADPVTGLAAKDYFMAKLQKELDKGRRLSLVTFRIKDHPDINSLKQIGHLITKNSRRTRNVDFISRYTEDTFCVILHDTPLEQAKGYAERVKDIISRKINMPLDFQISPAEDFLQTH